VTQDELRGDTMIVVADPTMTHRANELLAEELRSATGARSVELHPPERPGKVKRRNAVLQVLSDTRSLVGTTAALLVVVFAILAVTSSRWWGLAVAIVVLLAMATLVITRFELMAGEGEHLDPDTAADLEAEGVPDPDREFARRLSALRRSSND
jgi:hypothetical protein